MKCLKCNFDAEQDFAFCPNCGEKVIETKVDEKNDETVQSESDTTVDTFVKSFIADKKRLWVFILGLITALSSLISITEFNFSTISTLALYSFFIYGVVIVLYSTNILKKSMYETDIILGGIVLTLFAFVLRFMQLGIAYSWEGFVVYLLKSLILLTLLSHLLLGKEKFKFINTGLIILAVYDIFMFITSGNAFFTGFIWKLFHISEACLLISVIFIARKLVLNIDKYSEILKSFTQKIPKLKTMFIIMLVPIIISVTIGVVRQINANKVNSNIFDNKVDTTSNSASEEKKEKKKDVQNVHLGETITLDFMEMFIESASYTEELKPTDTSNVYSYYKDEPDKKYFYLQGTIKNIGRFNYGVDNICVELNFDEKYKYNGHLIADDGGNDFYGDNVDPFDSVKFYMYSSIPDELISQYNKCTITFGFNENFGYNDDNTYSYISNMDKCEYIYKITVSK